MPKVEIILIPPNKKVEIFLPERLTLVEKILPLFQQNGKETLNPHSPMNTVETMQRPVEPKFSMEEFDTTMIDGLGKEHDAHIKWEGYLHDNSWRIVRLEVKTKYEDYYFDEVVIECLELHLGKRVTLETKIEQVC